MELAEAAGEIPPDADPGAYDTRFWTLAGPPSSAYPGRTP